ncbi:Multidrug resistance protein [Paramarasmius palmivorus]|uniref:Multidrug resistance protein n=1 Tax=Paramarasmius palmivorus TaxID=297713 RepID=A0AAW0D5G1_9AGAR
MNPFSLPLQTQPDLNPPNSPRSPRTPSILPAFLTYGGSEDTVTPEPPIPEVDVEQEVAQLARTFTQRSLAQHVDTDVHPFSEDAEPELDPRSEKFDPQRWLRSMFGIHSRDSQRYPKRTAGISFTNLNVYGYGKPTDYQKTVGNILLGIPDMIKGLLGNKGQRIDILRDFEGLVKDGEMLVVLGPPGSTFLKTIAGETHGFYVDQGAQINYQGIPWETMHKDFRGEVTFSAETDIHFPNLTVGQTLSFAALARTPHSRLPGVTREQWASHMKDVVMAIFGLRHTENTKVGNDFIRGCWDNSTRGLDSATALEFVKTLRSSTGVTGASAVVAIYQASQDIYDIFDKVTVLYEGRQIYFGPADEAKRYFVEMGFHCPERQTTADFLTSLTNPAERQAQPGFELKVPRTPDEFAKAWKESEDRKRLLEEIDEFNREYPVGGEHLEQFRYSRKQIQAKGMRSKSPYTITVPMQVRLCLRRAFQRLRGDMSVMLTTIIGNFIMALIVSSIFYNLKTDTGSFYSRSALLFYAVLMNAFSSILEILSLYEQRPIVEKHTRMALYHPFSEAISSMVCDLPTKIISAITTNVTLYFMTNLRRTASAFFIYLLFSFFCTLAMSMIFRTIGASSRTISQGTFSFLFPYNQYLIGSILLAMTPAAVIILALVVYSGFAIPTKYMHPWFRWINRANPVAYVFEALMANEFSGRSFECTSYVPSGQGYESASGLQRVCSTTGAQPGSSVVEGARYLAASFDYYRSHLWRNFGIVIVFIVFFCGTYLFATEYISAAKSKGEVLVYKQGLVPHQEKETNDEETTQGTVHDRADGFEDGVGIIQKQTAIFHWEDVCYDITIKGEPRRLLDHVDGWVEPGKLTALMGASGAGKTTLLDVLASRVTMGVISGSMFVDGKPRDQSFQRKTGYVQQQDLHLQTSTVREALIFSARLRQPSTVPDREKVEYANEVIRMLGMEKYADAVVGVPGEGLNVEQRKRLTIGVELAAKPQLLLFLDEPTSGLDSQTAWSICTLLRKLANNGQAILCTIHQPSALLFQEFDRLLFLARGGKTVYYGDIGPGARTLIDYFERQGAEACPAGANPAEWILSVIGAAPGAVAKRDYVEAWRGSDEYAAVKAELAKKRGLVEKHEQVVESGAGDGEKGHAEFAAPFGTQLSLCWIRVLQQYWRTPSYIYSKFALCALSSLFIGFTFWKSGNDKQGLQNQMYAVFMILTLFGNLANQIMPHFVTQRALYEVRERPSKTYSWKAFMLSNILAELPWNALMAVVVYCCWYFPIGMYKNARYTDATTEREGLMFLFILAFMLFTSTFTDLIIAGIDSAETGGNIATLAFQMCLIFCGVLVTRENLPGFWVFMNRVSPFTYLVDGMLSTGLANAPAYCSNVEISRFDPPSGSTCGDYLANYLSATGASLANPNATSQCEVCTSTSTNSFLAAFDSDYGVRWRNFGLMWAYIVFNLFGALFLYWLARVPKKSRSKNSA